MTVPQAVPPARPGGRVPTVRVLVLIGVHLAAAVGGAVLWRALAQLPEKVSFERDGQVYVVMPTETDWGQVFGIDATFVLITAVLGLVLGAGFTFWLRSRPVLAVWLVAAAGGVAGFVMSWVGLWIGPQDPATVLAGMPTGSTAPVRLDLMSDAAYVVWPLASLAGALVVLLVVLTPEPAPATAFGEDAQHLQ